LERYKKFLGCGWNFGLQVNQDGGISTSWHEDNIEQNIRIAIGTAPGERQMRPEFGCKIHDLIFHPNNRTTANLAEHHTQLAIVKWEPRVENVTVKANPDPYEENTMRIEITYTIRSTNTTRNLVYPFYLNGQED